MDEPANERTDHSQWRRESRCCPRLTSKEESGCCWEDSTADHNAHEEVEPTQTDRISETIQLRELLQYSPYARIVKPRAKRC